MENKDLIIKILKTQHELPCCVLGDNVIRDIVSDYLINKENLILNYSNPKDGYNHNSFDYIMLILTAIPAIDIMIKIVKSFVKNFKQRDNEIIEKIVRQEIARSFNINEIIAKEIAKELINKLEDEGD